MKLSEKILSLRKQRGFSQEELAEQLHVSRQAVSRWEQGSALPDALNILQLSKLFGVTADFLLNDEYESDGDVPIVKRTVTSGRRRTQRIAGACTAAFGLLGNFIIYLLSRFIPVMVPHITYENGEKWYHWSSQLTGYSYKYFVSQHNLEFLTVLFWLLTLAGLAVVFLKREHLMAAAARLRTFKAARWPDGSRGSSR